MITDIACFVFLEIMNPNTDKVVDKIGAVTAPQLLGMLRGLCLMSFQKRG